MRLRLIVGLVTFMAWQVLPTGVFAADYEKLPPAQGWNQAQMRDWYGLSQGSRLIPMDWLKALDTAEGNTFFTRKNLEEFGYTYLSDEPDSMPVGFVRDVEKSKSWLGFNCAACHTAKLKAGGAEVLIHGGQSMADFQAFTTTLITRVAAVQESPESFDRFSNAVIGEDSTAAQKLNLKTELTAWLAHRQLINDTGNSSHWGRGRADAVGIILATTAAVVADPNLTPEAREPLPASNAPVSYPFVWNTNQQARLQHNGVVDNGVNFGLVKVAKIGALIRNWTEALGVFADVKLATQSKKVVSSIRLDNLLRIEQALADLQSPQWPDSFGRLDEGRMARGAAHYQAACASCHGVVAATDTATAFPLLDEPRDPQSTKRDGFVYLQPLFDKRTTPKDFDKTINPSPRFIGTDPGMACNALIHSVPTGRLEGEKNVKGVLPSFGDGAFAERAITTDLLRVLIQRDVLANKTSSLLTIAENQLLAAGEQLARYAFAEDVEEYIGQNVDDDPLSPLRQQLQSCANYIAFARALSPDTPFPVYKSRPLNGIWATAPYLHNGSVPTLYDLLLPQQQRPENFGYFDGEMDTAKGGLKNASENPAAFQFYVYDEGGKVVTGNWNGGHEYGFDLSHEQRLDLVEYLKGL